MHKDVTPVWHILGAGAMGCLWAYYLKSAGHPTTLLLKNCAALERFLSTGNITINSATSLASLPVRAELTTQKGNIDYLLLTTKAYDVIPALSAVAHRLHPNSVVILMQNGMGIAEQVCQQFPELNFLLATTTIGAHRNAPFCITEAGLGPTYLGNFAQCMDPNLAQQVYNYLCESNLDISFEPNLNARLWQKLAISCTINPLTAILNCKNGELIKSDEGIQLIKAICDEVETIAQANKIAINQPYFQQVLNVAKQTAENYSSMWQDIQRGRQTEIQYTNGFVIQQGENLQVETPTNQWLIDIFNQLEEESSQAHTHEKNYSDYLH